MAGTPVSAVASREEFTPAAVELQPMRRRHLRAVMRIEEQVYPRPWSISLFVQEITRRSDRAYLVARHGNDVVGYGGLMMTVKEGHITTIAVDPVVQRRGVGKKIMLGLMEAAAGKGAKSVSLEVRKTNAPAQRLYEQFGFRAVGIRKGYYQETNEDAIVMWVDGVDSPDYADLLGKLSEH